MATTIYNYCLNCHVDPTDMDKNIFEENFEKLIYKNDRIDGCDRGNFVGDHCNSRCTYKEIIARK
jgi:hypothetical protein